jgi:hypothetical protein
MKGFGKSRFEGASTTETNRGVAGMRLQVEKR